MVLVLSAINLDMRPGTAQVTRLIEEAQISEEEGMGAEGTLAENSMGKRRTSMTMPCV